MESHATYIALCAEEAVTRITGLTKGKLWWDLCVLYEMCSNLRLAAEDDYEDKHGKA
jgi:hypothetical protein